MSEAVCQEFSKYLEKYCACISNVRREDSGLQILILVVGNLTLTGEFLMVLFK